MTKVRTALSLFALLVASTGAATTATAQKDVIILTDGTEIRNVKVLEWNAKEIKFRAKGSNDTRAAHLVKDASVEKIREAMLRADEDPGSYVTIAEEKKDDAMIAPYALYKAAMMFYDDGKATDMIAALQKIDTDYPESPWAPEYYRWKIKYYCGKQKPDFKSAASTAIKYGDASRKRSWGDAYTHDAEYWEAKVKGMSKAISPDQFASTMRNIVGRSGGIAPFVAQEAMADLADIYRKQRKYDEAKAQYKKLRDQKGLGADVRARMYLGLGYISLEAAIESKDKGDYHEAFKNFLRVYLNAKSAHPELVAEGLYQSAKACEAWNELPTCKLMAGRLRGRLKYREPYKNTSWATKK